MSDDENTSYDVGYKRPPKEHQYKAGQSGNPAGRPPKSKQDLSKLLLEDMTVREDGQEIEMDPREAALLALAQKALKGDTRALIASLKAFEHAGLFEPPAPPQSCGVMEFPAGIPGSLALLLLKEVGAPPWSKAQINRWKLVYLEGRSKSEIAMDMFTGFE